MKKKSCILLLFSFFWSLASYGQLDSIHTDSITSSITFPDVVITGAYVPTDSRKAIHQVRTITRKQFESRGAVTLDQALISVPSIRLHYDPILGTFIRMRGMTSENVTILIDGVPVIGRLGGGVDISQIPLSDVKKIEIVEGALSNLYGNNAAGGVINIITAKNTERPVILEVQTQLESTGLQSYHMKVGYKYKSLLASMSGRYMQFMEAPLDSLRLTKTITLPEGEEIIQSKYPYNQKTQKGLNGLLRYDFNSHARMHLRYDNINETVTDPGVVRRPQYKPYANDLFFHTKRDNLTFHIQSQWDNLYIENTTAWSSFRRVVEEKRYYLEEEKFDSLLMAADTTDFNSLFGKLVSSYKINDLFTIAAGYQYQYEIGSGDKIINNGQEDSTRTTFLEGGLFLDGQMHWKGFNTSISTRFIHHNIYDIHVTPAINIMYRLNDNLTIRGSYAHGFRSPSLKEVYLEFIDINHYIIGNTELKPERSQDIQCAVEYQAPNFFIDLKGYYTHILDRISLSAFDELKYKYTNVSEYKVKGLQSTFRYEWKGISYQLGQSLGFWATNLEEFGAPKFRINYDLQNSLQYEWDDTHTTFILQHRFTGKQPSFYYDGNDVKSSEIHPFHFLDGSIQSNFWKKRIGITLGIRNILNVRSINISGVPTSGSAHSSPGLKNVSVGRSFFATLKLSY